MFFKHALVLAPFLAWIAGFAAEPIIIDNRSAAPWVLKVAEDQILPIFWLQDPDQPGQLPMEVKAGKIIIPPGQRLELSLPDGLQDRVYKASLGMRGRARNPINKLKLTFGPVSAIHLRPGAVPDVDHFQFDGATLTLVPHSLPEPKESKALAPAPAAPAAAAAAAAAAPTAVQVPSPPQDDARQRKAAVQVPSPPQDVRKRRAGVDAELRPLGSKRHAGAVPDAVAPAAQSSKKWRFTLVNDSAQPWVLEVAPDSPGKAPNLYVENITRTAPPVMAVIPPVAGGGRYLLPARRAVFLSMAKEDPPLYFRLLDHLGQTEGGCNLVFAQGQRPHLNLRPDLSPRRKSALEQTCLVIGQMLQLRKDEWPKDPQGQASAAN